MTLMRKRGDAAAIRFPFAILRLTFVIAARRSAPAMTNEK
jgi:hypothetical protein